MFSTSVGSYYDGLVKRAELNGQKQQEMTEELISSDSEDRPLRLLQAPYWPTPFDDVINKRTQEQ